MENRKNSFTVPLAIVIAGALIAVSLYFSNSNSNQPVSTPVQNNTSATPTAVLDGDIAIRPVGASDHVLGNPKASLAIVEFSDTECPFCK